MALMARALTFFFSSRRRHTRYWRDWSFRRVLFRSEREKDGESWWLQMNSPHSYPIPGLACLHIATLQRNRPLMELLLQNGADIDAQVRWPIREIGRAPCRERV